MGQKLKSFFKKCKIKGKKRKIILSVGLAWKLAFGQAEVISAQPYILSFKSPVVQEKEILNEERDSNSFDASYNSGKIKTIQTGSGYVIKIQNSQTETPEALKSALEICGGELGKGSSPGARAKADARRNFKAGKFSSGSTIIPGADGFVLQRPFCRYHENVPFCKPRVKANGAFQDNGNNPPPEDSKFDFSHYKGGPNPFIDKFDYDNPNHTRENTDFSNQRRMNHSYDGHAEKCFGMQQTRNKQTLQKFEKTVRDYIESLETKRINGSYRYETPAYHYKKPGEDLIVTVNATNNEYISVRNGTDYQLEKLEIDGNLGYDSRPSMELKLRGPKQ